MAFTSSLYPGEVVVHDGSPTSLFMPQHGEGRGLELPPLSSPDGRRYGADAEPFPAGLLVPMSEMEARIREQEERKLRVSDLINHYGLPEKDQERTNYCWIYGVVQAQEVMRLRMNQPMVRLSAASAGARVKGFRNVGGWGLEAIKHLGLHGVNEEGDWPNATIDSRYDTPESRRKALDHRVTEWWELTPRSMHELASLLLMGIPAGVGYNWWGHEVMAADPLWLDGTLALRIRNQWKGWGSNNFGVLQGSLMYPDDTVAPRQSVAA